MARFITFLVGLFMIGFAFLVPKMGGAVEAYLTIIGIMDMPLFIVGILYGLLWKRATSAGAIWGYLSGAVAGIIGKFYYQFDFNLTTFLSAGVALIVMPLVSYLSRPESREKIERVWKARKISEEEQKTGHIYNIIPRSAKGKLSFSVYLLGLLIFLAGVISGSSGWQYASHVAVLGMIIYFAGGYLKILFD